MSNADESAFPSHMASELHSDARNRISGGGLTKREYFAAMAMQGLLSAVYSSKEMLNEFTHDEGSFRRHLTGCDAVSKCAASYANALIAELAKGNP